MHGNNGKEELRLYNFQADPKEQNNLIGQEREIANSLKQKLDEWLRLAKANSERSNSIPRYEINRIKEKMKNAGYWFLDVPKHGIVVGREVPKGVRFGEEEK